MSVGHKQELILFTHIPKTGGTTLRTLLEREYKAQALFLYNDHGVHFRNTQQIGNRINHVLPKIKCISGHFGYGITFPHLKKPALALVTTERPITYLAMVRNPVDQILSLYLAFQRQRRIPPHMTFEQFVYTKHCRENLQTYMISGKSSTALKEAKENILHKYAVVGVTDRYAESFKLMKKRFNWKINTFPHLNPGHSDKLRREMSSDLISHLQSKNQNDVNLYQFAKEKLLQDFNQL
ncbi:sulfotransferase family 2 domain-containing protein [Hazenella sp. IB182357]|uniref:Sulfotransferase family 2 domain-containing protein n=1 Tax=Polycladospora coralii TaxID=2771432 RepID=A0A926RTJ9_9BACL|nr:sulfotransferase family 2 domain-containing protein [Polycladospora coralii]MBD1371264.1 sulfotransferase family 2 domain-containing protein [Polycladospora coralii]